ncbi:long-chain-fatty-acid--CoA ligase [Conexibacter woesei]|uniref:AMP-dependent synthetase and ligase n=1 Tax=Conexibacter woesei (strain DSM 14684 / CCUG 47730 / CIP 108061 / JCM 11494 / NBRC 100937 / ID131577) TaxID=469383 RepID=D3F776_CONWI|nr:long-chain fatty acid--CoA ligase [Conexibacter woesei]ADB48847.1 AMP-dependent synthetase and ligase [Conexibacter woesei DSM 14684]
MQLSLASVLHESALRFPDRVAAIEDAREATYRELWDGALARAAVLRELGVRPGDRVALLAPNGIDFVTAYFGIVAAGAVVVPVAPMLVADEIEHLVRDSGARLALAEHGCAAQLAPAVAAAGVPAVVLRDGGDDDLTTRAGDVNPLPAAVARTSEEPAVLFYTSGTTGRPKGAILSHGNLVMNCFVNAFMANEFRGDDVVLGCLPLFHTFGQTVAMNSAFLVGATVVLQPRFDAADALALMRRHDVNVLIGVPTMYIALLEALGDGEPVALRMCVSGGAPLPVAVLEAFEARFGCCVQEGYGLSETSPTATVNQPSFGLRPGSIGHPLWGVEVEIARPEVEDRIELLGEEQLGEIVIRGHNVFAGYHGLPEATAAALVDGWFRTGDLGVKDADGFRHVIDRKKDMILRGGYNVYPREVEEALARHPQVEQVAVVGVPHPTHGEEVLAVVVARARAAGEDPLTAEELIAWAAERVARHKRPRLVAFAGSLPLGPSRKVLKRELRAQYAHLGEAP